MNIKPFFSLSMFIFLCAQALAQGNYVEKKYVGEVTVRSNETLYSGRYKWSNLSFPTNLGSCIITDSVQVDRSRLKIVYEARVVVDASTMHQFKDRVVTLIGNTWYHSYGDASWRINKMISLDSVASPEAMKYRRASGYSKVLPFFVYRNLKTKCIMNRFLLPEIHHVYYCYEEPQPAFNWRMEDSLKTIVGYQCQKAVVDYAGRTWSVWFTPDIPVDCGFWKFSGLPGLILEAKDKTSEYEFFVSSIEQVSLPINIYKSKDEKHLDKDAYFDFEKKTYSDPIRYSNYLNGVMKLIDKAQFSGIVVFTPGHLYFPYNPMELE